MILHLFNYVEMLALITSIFCFEKMRGSPMALFMPFMFFVSIIEAAGKYLGYTNKDDLNVRLFNISTVFEFVFYAVVFSNYIHRKKFKKIIHFFIPFYLIVVLVNQHYIQGFSTFHSYTMLIGSFFIIVFVFLYFYELFEDEKVLIIYFEPMFWISIGVFVFYLGDFTYNCIYPYLIKHKLDDERKIFRMINNNLIVLMYSCFSIAFLLCKKSRSTLSL